MCRLLTLVPLLALLLLGQAAPIASAGTAYVLVDGQVGPGRVDAVAVIDTATNRQVGAPIPTGRTPRAIAITPDGTRAYVVNRTDNAVSVIDTATNQPAAMPIPVAEHPLAIAITPDGRFAFVTREDDDRVSAIDTTSNTLVTLSGGREGFGVRSKPSAIAIAPDGVLGYVANSGDNTVTVFDVATKSLRGVPDGEAIKVGAVPIAIAISPDGSRIYVANRGGQTVSVIDAATHTVVAPPTGGAAIPVNGQGPRALAIRRDGKRVYVAHIGTQMAVINAVQNILAGPIATGGNPAGIALTADGSRAYVSSQDEHNVGVIATTSEKALQPIALDAEDPTAIAIAPDRSPIAAFTVPAEVRAGTPFSFDASTSTDPDLGGVVAGYAWDFGDGQSRAAAAPVATHTYAAPGTYTATLTVSDEEGCSVARTLLFTGQTAMGCIGSPLAVKSQMVTVLPPAGGNPERPKAKGTRDPDGGAAGAPRVKLTCPKSAKPRGCSFRLQAVAKKPKRGKRPQFTSAVAKAKLKPGRSVLVPLVAKAAFRAKLGTATSVLVKLDAKIGKSRKVGYRRLKVVRK